MKLEETNRALTYSSVVQLSLSAVTTGLFLTLTLWAFGDIVHRRKTFRSHHHCLYIIGLVLATLCLSNVLDFFLGLFYHQVHEGIALALNQASSTIITLGLLQILSHLSSSLCSHPGVVQATLQFIVVGLLLPLCNLSLSNVLLHQKWIQMTEGLLVGLTLFLVSRYQLLKMSADEMLANKIVLVFQCLLVLEATSCLLVDLIGHWSTIQG